MSIDIGSSPNPPSTAVDTRDRERSPRFFLIVTSILALVCSSLPYVIGYFGTRSGVYLWAGTSPSDFAVYLAWIRAAADGSVRDPHLFAGGYPGMLINPVYWLMGAVSGVTGLSGVVVYHAGRLVLGAGLLYVLWRFVRLCIPDPLARRLAFLFLCFSSGFGWCLGWLPLKFWSIDRWQPEAFTFLSLYSYPHFCAALMLQVACLGLLSKSVTTGDRQHAAAAGVCGCLLAIEHTYDVITVALIWLAYVIAPRAGGSMATRARLWMSTAIAGTLTAPGIIYIYLAVKSDQVFAQRVDEPTMSAPLYTILIGYGGVLLLAIYGAWLLNKRRTSIEAPAHPEMTGLLTIWAVVNVAVSYLPVLFQRKMLQGEHVALCVLAGIGAAHLLRRIFPSWEWRRLRWPEVALAVFLSIGSGVYLYHDTRDILSGIEQRHYRSTLLPGEVDALNWVRRNTPAGAVVQPVPWIGKTSTDPNTVDNTLALFTPGITGRPVYVGHWAETPDYQQRVLDTLALAFAEPGTSSGNRARYEARIDYLVFSQKRDPEAVARFDGASAAKARAGIGVRIRRLYGNRDADVYSVERVGDK